MNLINLLFLLFVVKTINACSLNCVEFQESGRYHSNCAFTTIGNASRCVIENFNQELIDAGITQRISTVNLKFNFNSYVTVIYLELVSTPSQKLIVQPERDHYEVATFYLVGRFEFPDNVLRLFPNVQLLALQSAYFPSGIPSFVELRHLTHIYSDKTEIGGSDLVITENFVSGLPDLEHLFFRTENTDRITFENGNVFRQLNVLTYLNLKRVSFNSVPLELLNPLVNLKILRISSAFISNLTFLENSGLTNIEEINLALNRINSLKPFENFPKLTELALFSNEVSYFDSPDLKGLKALKELDLDSNRIGYLSFDIFSELRDLQTLKLLRNQLRTFFPEHIQHLRDLKSVDLRLNKIICDCSLAWVSQVSDKYGLEFQGECTDSTNEGNAITEQSNYVSCTSPTFSLECFNRSNICRENSRCVGYANTFLCPCNHGFEEENGTCVDIDECERGIAQCEHHCSNLPGSYECCLPGFRIDSEGRCVDLNECFDTSLNNCTEICENTVGSYNCACNEGYELAADDRSCKDIDECSISNQDCSYKCENDVGGYHCECPVGYQLDRDGKRCIDNTSCHYLHAECDRYCQVNTGQFECVCGEGYIREIVGSVERCANIDECKIPQICSQGCEDSDGSYSCLCDPGSRLGTDNKTCVDIDECTEGKSKCTVLELCVNIENSYDCVCKHDHYIEGTDQCGFVPVYAYYVTGVVLLALALLFLLMLSLLICLFVYRRKQKTKEKRRINKQIYKEVSLQRTERQVTAYDPLNELENSEDSSPAHVSICDTPNADKYTKMYPTNAHDNVYDSIKEIAADNEAVST